jgi:hypothetical protein
MFSTKHYKLSFETREQERQVYPEACWEPGRDLLWWGGGAGKRLSAVFRRDSTAKWFYFRGLSIVRPVGAWQARKQSSWEL